MTWQPIETAPKDIDILVCKPGMDAPWTVRWRDGARKRGWQGSFGYLGWEPTLWAPIPRPPSDDAERDLTDMEASNG